MTSDSIQRRIAIELKFFGDKYGDYLYEDLKSALQEIADEARKEERDRIINLIKTNKQAYMTPATEERFLKDLSSLTKEEEHEN